MKYTDRKKTPLKWHRVVTFILLPLLILSNGCAVLALTDELMGLNLGFGIPFLSRFLNTAGVSVSNLGNWFWPVTLGYILEIIVFIGLIAIWIGMLRWKNSARRWWLVLILALTASCGIAASVFCRGLIQSGADTVSFHNLLKSGAPSVQIRAAIAMALVIAVEVFLLLFFLLNAVYYFKRRKLFAAYYTKQKEPVEMTEPKAEASGRREDSSESEKKPEPVLTHSEPESRENGKDEPAAVVSPAESPAVDQSEAQASAPEGENTGSGEEDSSVESTDADNTNEEKGILYCPSCGARLSSSDVNYCTHCGAKIR